MGNEPLAATESGSRDPLLLLNGYAASKADWDPTFVERLADASAVVCPDNCGIGESPPLEAGATIASMAGDVLALMDDQGIETADVAGWSMGGFIAQEIAARAPERVRRLVLLSTDPGGAGSVAGSPETWQALTDHSGTPREQATRLLGLLFPADFAAEMDAQFGDVVADARAALTEDTLDAQEAAMERWHEEPASERLRAIATPALVAAGTEDRVIPPVNSELLTAALPNARLELFDGGGHAFMAQEPDRLATLINEWLREP